MTPRLLILETSDRVGRVALGEGTTLVAERTLDAARRHARDLAPAVAELLAGQGYSARDLHGVIVSRGPGSYTGLRVGVMAAKTLAYATGCVLLGIDTFSAIAIQVENADRLDVLADAQQDKVYVKSFTRAADGWQPLAPLVVCLFADWLAGCTPGTSVTGPGLRKWAERIPSGVAATDSSKWDPQPASLLRLGLARHQAGERDDPFALEPIYLRPSSAEEQWAAQGARGASKG